jgi:preprotein translocase subunit SecA
VAYKNEAFTLFGDLMSSVWADYTRMIFNVQVNVEGENGSGGGQQAPPIPAFAPGGSSTRAGRVSYSGGQSAMGAGAIAAAAAAGGIQQGGAEAYENGGAGEMEALPVVEQRVVDHEHEVGRNDPCWCGSGKKFKKCHGS